MYKLFATLSTIFLLVTTPAHAKQVTVAGSTSVSRIMEVLAETYNKDHSNANITVQSVDSTAGVNLLINGTSDLGMASRYLTEGEIQKGLAIVPMAYDGIAIATNKTNPVKNLTRDQLIKIYQGDITNWKEVGGKDLAIAVVTREASSGSRYSFESLLGLTQTINGHLVSDINPKNLIVNSNGMMKTLINHNPQAIGYISMGSVDESTNAIKINSVFPTSESITKKEYQLARPFLAVYRSDDISVEAAEFLGYVISPEGQSLVRQYGYMPAQ